MASKLFQFKYGDYEHTPGECYPASIEIRPMPNRDGVKWAQLIRFRIVGDFCTSDGTVLKASDISDKIEELANAYNDDYKDAIWLDPDGNETPHKMISNDANNLSGVQVVSRSWDHALPANEYVNTRSYSITLQSLYLWPSAPEIFSFWETTTKIGTGGPRWKLYNLYDGTPVKETVFNATTVRYVTNGSLVGLTTWPDALAIVPPLWPADEELWKREIRQRSPRFWGDPTFTKGTHYQTDYTYHFHLPAPNNGWPSGFSTGGP